MTYKVLVCGGRDYYDHFTQEEAETYILSCLTALSDPPEKEDIVFISGMAKGADQIPIKLVEDNPEWPNPIEKYYADWRKHGPRAGSLRNIRMLEEGKPNMVIAFPTPTSVGTYHMIKISQKAGLPVHIYNE